MCLTAGAPSAHMCRFLGLDVYSLHSSAEAIVNFLNKASAGERARQRMKQGCLRAFRFVLVISEAEHCLSLFNNGSGCLPGTVPQYWQ